jgi:hypothetical protein
MDQDITAQNKPLKMACRTGTSSSELTMGSASRSLEIFEACRWGFKVGSVKKSKEAKSISLRFATSCEWLAGCSLLNAGHRSFALADAGGCFE